MTWRGAISGSGCLVDPNGARREPPIPAHVALAATLWHKARVSTRPASQIRRRKGQRCRSSVVEHSLGKGEVESSILSGSTIYPLILRNFLEMTALAALRNDESKRAAWRQDSCEIRALKKRCCRGVLLIRVG
jgi:hypothetical protein